MATRHPEYPQIRAVLEEADEPLTAREILVALDDSEIDSPHRIATVLGWQARTGEVDVIEDRPYRYHV